MLLILTLPTRNASARMRAWRALKGAGAAVLRDGVYVLPAGPAHRAALAAVAADVDASGGTAWLLEAGGADFTGLFDRTPEYGRLAVEIAACRTAIDRLAEADLARRARKLRKIFDALAAIDFYPGQARLDAAAQLDRLDADVRARLQPGEPAAGTGAVVHHLALEYRRRLWATRKRPWVDRLASAWLIRRFIDPDARFIWLDEPADCPPGAVGFDFEGAEFGHVGERVTFETLLASFGLDADPGLARVAGMVHYLDVGGLPVPESAGLEALLGGMHAMVADDDALLEAATGAFDYLYSSPREGA
ncbi:chromate resistance protein ChrB domain-containing protein [Parasulfuritortus cantonensis]|nr:chromate resistance protein ChrB domain-containing protein [Parasulfuritortus cantonensis]